LARADDLATEPMLRINAGGHIGRIRGIATDANERFAVTASYDKTVRVWSLPDGKVLRTIWLPSGNGYDGQVYAVALSPDGGTIAVVGSMGQPGNLNIDLFDRASGELRQRLPGLPNSAFTMRFSPDGRRLAVGMRGANGIRVFDASNDYRLLPSDSDYGDDCYSVNFDRDGRLVSASLDGFVRLYATDHYDKPVVPKTKVKGVSRPWSVAFSPDGRHVAVSDFESATVAIVRGRDLGLEFFPSISDFQDTELSVAWSEDGRRLYAGGFNPSKTDRLARRWDNGGLGNFIDITCALSSLQDFVPLSSQRMLFADGAGFGVIDGAGKAVRLQDRASIDLRAGAAKQTILVSADARTVQVRDLFKHVLRFDLMHRTVATDPTSNSALSEPTTSSTSIKLTDWDNHASPMVNGAKIPLDPTEPGRSVALIPGTDRFVLGAEWSLGLFDSKGKEIWSRDVPDVAYGVNVSADGKIVVAAYYDGTIRWHRVSDGEELLALFMTPDGQRWIAWTPQGYYDASAGGDDLIGWQVNHGYDKAADYFPGSQFQERFNRRDVIARVLDTLDVDKALEEANKAAGAPIAKAAPLPTSALTPVVEIKDPAPNSEQTSQELSLSSSSPHRPAMSSR
jgi:WD40 repeat protein